MATAGLAVSFLGGSTIDATLMNDLRGCNALEGGVLSATLGVATSFLSFADADSLQRALEDLSSAHGLKPKASKSIVRSLVLMLGGAVKFGLTVEALGNDMKTLGSFFSPLLLPPLHARTRSLWAFAPSPIYERPPSCPHILSLDVFPRLPPHCPMPLPPPLLSPNNPSQAWMMRTVPPSRATTPPTSLP